MAVFAAVLTVLGIAAYTDLRSRLIPNACPVALLCIGTVSCLYQRIPLFLPLVHGGIILLLFLSIALFADASLRRKGIEGCGLGGGDVKLLAALAFTQGAGVALLVATLGLLVAVLYKAYKNIRNKGAVTGLPLAPFFLVGFVSFQILLKGG